MIPRPNFNRSRRVLTTLALAGVVSLASLAAQQAPVPAAPGTGMIAGQVIDSETGRGVPGATVMVAAVRMAGSGGGGAVGRPGPPVKTDSLGRFVFNALAAGNYLLQVQIDGYAGSAGSAVRILELTDKASVTDIKVHVVKLGTISGTVRDDAGDAVVGVDVLAFRRTSLQGRPPTFGGAGRAKSDDRGQYRLTNLAPGEYFICACSREPIPFDGQLLTTLAARPLDLLVVAGRAAKAGADAASLDSTLRTFAPTFHPNTTLAGRATRVRVSGARPQTAIDIDVTAVRATRVSGMVLGLPNGGLSANAVRLFPVGDTPEAVAITQLVPMLVQPDGRFDFAGVTPGQYILDVRFTPGGPGGGPSGAALAFIGGRGGATGGARGGGPPADLMWATQTVVVGDEDVTGLVIGLQLGATITGRLEFVGNSPQPVAQALQRGSAVLLNSMEPPPRSSSTSGPVAADGTFRIAGVVPGRYAVFSSINVPGWPTVRSVTLGGVDITDTIIDIDGRDLANLVLSVTDVAMAEIRGTVSASVGSGDPGAWVRLFPAERRYWDEPFGAIARFKSVNVDKNAFAFTRVPEGEYLVAAVGDSDGSLDWLDKVTLDAMSRSAERVRVVNGDKKVLEVKR